MDNELTKKIQQWLSQAEHSTKDDIINGAVLLLKLNRNRILFSTILRNPLRYVKKIEYELGKFLKIRLDGYTMEEVVRMDAELTPQVKAAVEAEPDNADEMGKNETLPTHKGKRPDHDKLPEHIKAIWQQNADRWKKIKELYNALLQQKQPCDRYEFLAQMKDLWYTYKREFARYDDYKAPGADSHVVPDGLAPMADSKDISNARSYLSKMVKDDKLLGLKKASQAADADEKAIESYNTALKKTQERVQLLLDNNEPIGDDLRQKLIDAGVVFPSEQPSETVEPGEKSASADGIGKNDTFEPDRDAIGI